MSKSQLSPVEPKNIKVIRPLSVNKKNQNRPRKVRKGQELVVMLQLEDLGRRSDQPGGNGWFLQLLREP